MDLLEKASVILTPTAYNNGEALCVKPSDGSGDFDFSRNSAATRVNAQGLVENVQILSSNLVQNPSFSEEGAQEVSNGSFSQEGVQLITNGDFATDTAWGKQTGWSIQNGYATQNGSGSFQKISQIIDTENGKIYKIKVSHVLNGVSLSIRARDTQPSGTVLSNLDVSTDGISELTFTAISNKTAIVFQNGNANIIQEIDNVSVREVGQDWVLGTGWSIGEDKAICDGTQASNSLIYQNIGSQANKTVKFSFTVTNYVSGVLETAFFGAVGTIAETISANGDYTFYIAVQSGHNGNTGFTAKVGFEGSITNISVKEVGMDWTLGTDWGIGNNKAIRTGTASSGLTQSYNFGNAKKYRLKFTISDFVSGSIKAEFSGGGGSDLFFTSNNIGNGTFTFETTTTTNRTALQFYAFSSFQGSITNISVIEITTDTNLPRINYEGFSYQDALGSELVTNGGFDDGLNGWSTHVGSILELENGMAKVTVVGSQGFIKRTDLSIETGKTYFCKAYITNGTPPKWYINGTNNLLNLSLISENTYGAYVTVTGNSPYFYIRGSNTDGEVTFIDNVSVKEYLGQEVVPNSGCGSWLFEPQSTNLLEYSENFISGNWQTDDVTISSDLSVSPSGESYSSIVVVNTVASRHNIKRTKAGVNTATLSIFAKAKELNYIQIASANTTGQFANFDLSNGTIGSVGSSFSNAKIENYGNGWYRCSVVSDNQYNQAIFSLVTSATSPWLQSWTSANNTDGLYIWGAMLDENPYVTSYIPSNGSTVTRNQDLCTNGGSLATINSTEGTLYFEGAVLSNDGTDRVFSLNSGSFNNRVQIGYTAVSNQLTVIVQSNGAIYFNATTTLADATQINKIAVKYSLNNFSLWINGVEAATDTSGNTPVGLNNLDFNISNVANFFGKTKAVAVWKEALSDAELTELTTI